MTEFAYDLFIILHLLGFVYWLGGDVGVYYSSGFVINPKYSTETRLIASKIMMDLDLIPRICMTLMLTIGATLASLQGVDHYPGQLIVLWILSPLWLFMVVYMHFRHGSPLAKTLGPVDFWLRRILIAGIAASVIYTLYTGRLDDTPWLTAKVGLFGYLIFCGVMIRRYLPDYIAGLQALAKGSITDDENTRMAAGLKKARPWVLSIWAVVFIEAVLGVVKPGNELVLKMSVLF
ncbi:MAG: hypothetical protein P8L79_03290 [Rhodospirillaceae bacterium]|jgi:hypothetical protein|nr:hypothetical protein [Rhodospirillaceae bacterium]